MFISSFNFLHPLLLIERMRILCTDLAQILCWILVRRPYWNFTEVKTVKTKDQLKSTDYGVVLRYTQHRTLLSYFTVHMMKPQQSVNTDSITNVYIVYKVLSSLMTLYPAQDSKKSNVGFPRFQHFFQTDKPEPLQTFHHTSQMQYEGKHFILFCS